MSLLRPIVRGIGYPLLALLAVAALPVAGPLLIALNYWGLADRLDGFPGVEAGGGIGSGVAAVGYVVVGTSVVLAVVSTTGALGFQPGIGGETTSDRPENTETPAVPTTAASSPAPSAATVQLTAGDAPTSTPTRTAATTVSIATPTPTVAPTPTATPSPTPTPTATPTPSPTATPTLSKNSSLEGFRQYFVEVVEYNNNRSYDNPEYLDLNQTWVENESVFVEYNINNNSNLHLISGEVGIIGGSYRVAIENYDGLDAAKLKARAVDNGSDCMNYEIKKLWAMKNNRGIWSSTEYTNKILNGAETKNPNYPPVC